MPRAKGRGDSQAEQEPVGLTLPLAEARGRGSQPGSGPCPTGPSMLGLGFRVISLTSWYAFLCFFFILLLSFWSVTDLYFFDSGRMLMGLSIAPTLVQEVWRPTLQHARRAMGRAGRWRQILPFWGRRP